MIAHGRKCHIVEPTSDGVMYRSTFTPEAVYLIEPAEPCVHHVVQIDQSRYPKDGEPRIVPIPYAEPTSQRDGQIGADTEEFIDFMVLHTPAAQASANGASAMTALIANAISASNTEQRGHPATASRIQPADCVHETASAGTDLDNLTD